MSSPPGTDPVLPNGFSLDSENTVLTDADSTLTWPDRDNRPALRAQIMEDRDEVDGLDGLTSNISRLNITPRKMIKEKGE